MSHLPKSIGVVSHLRNWLSHPVFWNPNAHTSSTHSPLNRTSKHGFILFFLSFSTQWSVHFTSRAEPLWETERLVSSQLSLRAGWERRRSPVETRNRRKLSLFSGFIEPLAPRINTNAVRTAVTCCLISPLQSASWWQQGRAGEWVHRYEES